MIIALGTAPNVTQIPFPTMEGCEAAIEQIWGPPLVDLDLDTEGWARINALADEGVAIARKIAIRDSVVMECLTIR